MPKKEFKILPEHYRGDALIYLLPAPENENYTSLDLRDGKVSFQSGGYYYIGLAVLKKSILNEVAKNQFSDLAVIFKKLSEEKKLDGTIFQGEAIDLGDYDKYVEKRNSPVFFDEELKQFKEFLKMRAK